jgi:hypothetical protein
VYAEWKVKDAGRTTRKETDINLGRFYCEEKEEDGKSRIQKKARQTR